MGDKVLSAQTLGGGLELVTSKEAGPYVFEISAQLQSLAVAVGKQRAQDGVGCVVADEESDWAVHP